MRTQAFSELLKSTGGSGSVFPGTLRLLWVHWESWGWTLPHWASRKPRGENHQGHVTVCLGVCKGREKAGEKKFMLLFASVCVSETTLVTIRSANLKRSNNPKRTQAEEREEGGEKMEWWVKREGRRAVDMIMMWELINTLFHNSGN